MKVIVDSINILPKSDNSKLIAYATITLSDREDSITFYDFYIKDGQYGPFVSFPQKEGKNKKWFDWLTMNENLKNKIHRAVLAQYKKRISSKIRGNPPEKF